MIEIRWFLRKECDFDINMWRIERERAYCLKRTWWKVKWNQKVKEKVIKGWKRGWKFGFIKKIWAYINAWGLGVEER